nr:Ig-like domain-containing protein [Akkermansiaceae bacterium]
MKKHHRSACILALALGALPAAHAELLVYEPFYYPVGVLTGQNGGTGFASGWVASTGVNQQGSVWNEATSVLFDGSTLNWNGALNNNFPKSPVVGARYAGATPSVSSDLAISRTLASSAGAMADANGVLWMSGVFHFENRNLGAGITMGLGDGYIANRGRAFQAAATTDFIGVNGSTSASAANFRLNAMVTEGGWTAGQFAFTAGPVALPTPATTDLIVIMKFTFRGPGLADDVEAAFFTEDTLLAEITEANFNSSPSKVTASYAAGIDENGLTVLSVAQGRFNNAMDEIRIGKTFASVVNFPAPGAVDVAASAVKASPTALPADGTSTATVTVTLMDALGVPVPGKDVTLAKAEGPAGAIIDSPTTVTTGGNGQAAFTVRSSGPGTAVFAATCAPDLEITQTASVTFVSSADADESTVVAEPIYVDANGSSTSTVTVTLKSAEGVPVAGKNVTLTGNPATAVITPVAPTSDANGVATFTVSSATPGTVVFTATDVTDNNLAITETASVNFVGPVNAGLSTVVASPAAVVANGTATSTITVSLKDANGFPTAGKEVTLAAGTENPVIVPESAMTNASGVATFTVSSGTIGTEVFTATAGSVTITQTASVEFLNPLTPFAVNVNFNAFTGGNFTPGFKEVESELFGPAGGLGTRWNQFSANSSSGMLLNPAGVGTSVAFTTDFSEGRYDGTGAIPMLRSTLTDFAKGSARTFTLTGLPPGALYDIWLTAFRNQPSATERIYGRWTANNPTTSPTVQFIDNRDGQNGASFVEGYNYIVFESVK